jgi:hypothetical protein
MTYDIIMDLTNKTLEKNDITYEQYLELYSDITNLISNFDLNIRTNEDLQLISEFYRDTVDYINKLLNDIREEFENNNLFGYIKHYPIRNDIYYHKISN